MSDGWFESVAEAQRRARRRLPRSVYGALKRAADAGATAISVSNHGGNDLDGTPATIRVLPPIAAAVGDQVEVVLDGGIRRGGDVVKAVEGDWR